MGGASRLIMLLTTPFPLLLRRPRPSPNPALLRLARQSHSLSSPPPPHNLALSPTFRPRLCSPLKASQPIHTQTSTLREDRDFSPNSHPWPEWSKLIDSLSSSGYLSHEREADDEFVAYDELPDEFVRASRACLGFARDRSDVLGLLSRRDIGVIVENGTAFLFKSALDTARRMRAFLGVGAGNALESDKARTVDLMKYLLSYASKPTLSSERGSLHRGELIESAVRNLLSELARLGCGISAPEPSASVQHQLLDRCGQTPRPIGQNIEMKRGDWICARCNFMNFARNVKCLECEEARPKRQLTGGEWECPQCDFFNYGRNQVCLRCDCKRPGEASVGTTNSSVLGFGKGVYANNPDIESRLAASEDKAQRWFSKVSQLNSSSDLSSAAAAEDFPEIMPLRKGVNRFVVSTRKTPLERSLANSQYQKNMGYDNRTGNLNAPIGRSLDEILGRTSSVSDAGKKNVADGENVGTGRSPSLSSYGHPKGSNSSYVPFVPLPNDMFSKNPQKMEDGEKVVTESYDSVPSKASEQTSSVSLSSETGKSLDSSYGKPSNQAESLDKEKEQTEKSETGFKKVAELYDSTNSASATSDDDFPEFMPMRKGENRFVVSKKKDRSLTSPMYKRRMAMEQTDSANFVPFVPFPPDYFAKKDKQNPDGEDSTVKATGEISSGHTAPEKSVDNRPGLPDIYHAQRIGNQQTSTGRLNLQTSGDLIERESGVSYGSPISGNLTQNSFDSQNKNQDTWSTGFSGKESGIESSNLTGGSTQQPENQNVRSGWTGKSLEGSAVQEPDPLDMSEEAKAQRWFRRVAQIKDISELSNIPDEDFPSIMPMRKGVNRFVVSKRKTPLERRLTSPQYRRNLPIVSSDPVKKENENS
ncbi:zinc finger protein VAR3, chloroplastic-like [Actinidia eriantha]|uniref:zinc finger protein VAR3, chloroplastic-like n=1 Tax=Actinidia eriantha TaxID=165200 RepID=UPI002586F891|nr:zinc finger protein VAR3, chloroplastic-like [Actinidia eriantha]